MRNKPERTGDLGAAVDATDREALHASLMLVFMVGVVVSTALQLRQVGIARRAERAEWALQCQLLENERDDARARAARFTAGGGDVVDEHGS